MARASKPDKTHKHDWQLIRSEYVQTAASHRDLARKFKASERQIALHSVTEGWVTQREEYRSKVAAVSAERGIDKHVEALSKGRDLASANARMILNLIAARLSTERQELTTPALLQLAKSNEAAFLSLCKALGIVPVVESGGDSEVELPDTLDALTEGVTPAEANDVGEG